MKKIKIKYKIFFFLAKNLFLCFKIKKKNKIKFLDEKIY